MRCLDIRQTLLTSSIRTVRRICIFISGLKRLSKNMRYLRIFEAFIKFGKTHVLSEFLKKDFDKDATAKLVNSNNDYNGDNSGFCIQNPAF